MQPARKEFLGLAESIGKSLNVAEVPLVLADVYDQREFLDWFAPLIGARRFGTEDPYPLSRLLDSLDQQAYAFVTLHATPTDDFYLIVRDYALNRRKPIETRLGQFEIHPEHRLALFIDSRILRAMPVDLQRVLRTICWVKHFSSGAEGAKVSTPDKMHNGHQLFPSVADAVAWCERYYGGRRFVFRGQAKDWPLKSTMQRQPSEHAFERAAQRTARFCEWLLEQDEAASLGQNTEKAMAIAQHHGLPTGLLDLSWSPAVAAYFATDKLMPPDAEPGVIFVFSRDELEEHLSFSDDAANELGPGLLATEVPEVRRLRNQQGLFVASRPTLVDGYLLTKLYFCHGPGDEYLLETERLPREFIFPWPSPLERAVVSYLVAEAAIGHLVEDPELPYAFDKVSFDSGCYSFREPAETVELLSPAGLKMGLDWYASLLTLTASYVFAHASLHIQALLELSSLLDNTNTQASDLDLWRKDYRALHAEMNRPRAVDGGAISELSVRDLVDNAAFYHHVRSSNLDFQPEHLEAVLPSAHARLWSAYRVADHWLGQLAFDWFPHAANFALNCPDPVSSFLAAIRAIGERSVGLIDAENWAKNEQYLEAWTTLPSASVERVAKTISPSPVLRQRLEARAVLQRESRFETSSLGGFVFRAPPSEDITAVLPTGIVAAHGKFGVRTDDKDRGQVIMHLEMLRSVADRLAGLEVEMACHQVSCPFHAFKLCARRYLPPDSYQSCHYKASFEQTLKLSPERLTALGAFKKSTTTAAPVGP